MDISYQEVQSVITGFFFLSGNFVPFSCEFRMFVWMFGGFFLSVQAFYSNFGEKNRNVYEYVIYLSIIGVFGVNGGGVEIFQNFLRNFWGISWDVWMNFQTLP